MLPNIPPGDDLPCKVKVGFLFKRTCGRMDRVGCEVCHGQPIPVNAMTTNRDYDPYWHDRSMYNDYGRYDRNYWYSDRYSTLNDPNYNNNQQQFTDADSAAVGNNMDSDFEQRLDAS